MPSGSLTATTAIEVKKPPSGAQLFSVNDRLRLKAVIDGSVEDNWLEVLGAPTDGGDTHIYPVERKSGDSATFPKGVAVVNYGQEGDGFVKITSDEADSPFIDVSVTGATPWNEGGITNHVRMGYLNGLGVAGDEWGLAAGKDLSDSAQAHVIISDTQVALKGVAQTWWDGAGNTRGELDPSATGNDDLFWLGVSAADKKLQLQADGDLIIEGDITITNPGDINTSDLNNDAGWTEGADWDVNLVNIPGTLETPAGSGLFLSSTYMGYYADSAWQVYIDNAGNLVLGDTAGGNAGITWDQAGETLTVQGSIEIVSGSGLGNLSDAGALALLDDIDLSYVTDSGDLAGMSTITLAYVTDSGDLASGDDLDDVDDGATYGKVLLTQLSAGKIQLVQAEGDLDDIDDGTSYAKVLSTSISAGKIILSQATGDLDDIDDGDDYAKILSTEISAGHIKILGSDGATTVIDGGEIQSESIKTGDIAADAITAAKIDVTSLSAVSADMGSLTAGSVVITTGSDKIWLNDSDDGGLHIGGTVKGSAPFSVAADGSLTATGATISGALTATTGTIGGWDIDADEIKNLDGSAGITLDSSVPKIELNDGTCARVFIGNEGSDYYIAVRDADGNVVFNSKDTGGGTPATEPSLAGWYISQYKLQADSGAVGMNSEATAGTDWRFWAGNATPGSAPFRVDEDGDLVASSATITGEVNATSGAIAGWDIDANSISKDGNIGIDSGTKDIWINNQTWEAEGVQLQYHGGDPRFYVGDGSTKYAKFDGTDFYVNGVALSALASGSELAMQNWVYDADFSNTDSDTVEWASGTLTFLSGDSYSIDAGNTGDLSDDTPRYIYFDKTWYDGGNTTFRTSDSLTDAIGANKVLIATALLPAGEDEPSFTVFGAFVNQKIHAAMIVGNTITASEIAASTITATEINVSQLSAIAADLGTITAGSITSVQQTWVDADGNVVGEVNPDLELCRGVATVTGTLSGDGTEVTVGETINLSSAAVADIFWLGPDEDDKRFRVTTQGHVYLGDSELEGDLEVTGTILAGGGDVVIDNDGITLNSTWGDYTDTKAIKFGDDAYISAYHGASLDNFDISLVSGIGITMVDYGTPASNYHAIAYQAGSGDDANYHYFYGGGVYIGLPFTAPPTNCPVEDELFTEGDVRVGKGLQVGTLSGDQVSDGDIWYDGLLLAPDGSASDPSITFDGDPDTGFYNIGADNIGLALGGTKYIEWNDPTGLTGDAVETITVTNGDYDYALSFVAGDVAHGMTAICPGTSHWGGIRKLASSGGGLYLDGFADENSFDGVGMFLAARVEDETDQANDYGVMTFQSTRADGTGQQALSDSTDAFVWFNHSKLLAQMTGAGHFVPSGLGSIGSNGGELTISSGAITVTGAMHSIEGEGAVGDELDTINGGVEGAIIRIHPADSAHDITLIDGDGNLDLNGVDVELTQDYHYINLIYNGTNWEIFTEKYSIDPP